MSIQINVSTAQRQTYSRPVDDAEGNNKKRHRSNGKPGPWSASQAGSLPKIKRAIPVEVANVTELEKLRNRGDCSSLFARDAEGFEAIGISNGIAKQLDEKLQISKPTQVQSLSIPHLLKGGDVLVQSQTGSGKTLAFLLPILNSLVAESRPRVTREMGTLALVLSPTRELCLQTHAVFSRLTQRYPQIVAGVVMGGQKMKSEKASLRKGVTVLVCTPGRLLDHIQNTAAFNISNCEFFILDEADRLLDLGFEKDLQAISDALKATTNINRLQCALFSATLDKRVKKLGSIFLKDPVTVECSLATRNQPSNSGSMLGVEGAVDIPSGLMQGYVTVPDRLRLVALCSFLRWKIRTYSGGDDFKAIVFVSTCDQVEFYHQLFTYACWPPQADPNQQLEEGDQELVGEFVDQLRDPLIPAPLFKLHGSMSAQERNQVFSQFRKCKGGVLLCTDVAARGLDLPSLDWIIQFNPPADFADYIHRIGRTARLGRRGRSLIILSQPEAKFATTLQENHIKLDKLDCTDLLRTLQQETQQQDLGDCTYASMAKQFVRLVEIEPSLKVLGASAFTSYMRAYAAYPRALRSILSAHNLHLGHVASSFGLREPPSRIASKAKQPVAAQDDADQTLRKRAGRPEASQHGRKWLGAVGDGTRRPVGRNSMKGPFRLPGNNNSMSEFAA
ncbi:ATP-dependent RNA helicase [Plasmodiophora brassicae]